jgi:membrane-associated phospholipid phosphatase
MPELQQPYHIIERKKKRAITFKICATMLSFLLALAVVSFFIKRIFFLKKDSFDQNVFVYLKQHVSDENTSIMEFFTLLGSQYFLIPAFLLLMAYYFFVRKNTWNGIRVAVVSLSSLGVMFALKMVFKRPRPDMPLLRQVEGLSFPSGHAFMSFSFFGIVIYLIYKSQFKGWKRYLAVCIFVLITLLVGISRIYLRVHYASDVIAGFCMGFMWMVITLVILRQIESRRNLRV